MSKTRRKVIRIDEEKCDGCGLCVSACPEEAVQIVDGKAKLVKESFCDGLGACLGECPRGALSIEEKEVEQFDEVRAKEHMEKMVYKEPLPCECLGTMTQSFDRGKCIMSMFYRV